MTAPRRVDYGPHPSQHAEWSAVPGARGTVVVIHGGFWRARYDLSLGRAAAQDLTARGWSVLNLEYRRVGDGGGAPATFDDVAAGIELLAGLPDVPAGPTVLLGHSAGGHLAAWAAARGRYGWPDEVAVDHVVVQAGVLDLGAAYADHLSSDAVVELLGHPPGEDDERFDPVRQVPLATRLTCLHARDDDAVPFSQSSDYVAAARAAGGRAALVVVSGGHFGVIDPGHPAWAAVLAAVEATDPDAERG